MPGLPTLGALMQRSNGLDSTLNVSVEAFGSLSYNLSTAAAPSITMVVLGTIGVVLTFATIVVAIMQYRLQKQAQSNRNHGNGSVEQSSPQVPEAGRAPASTP